MRFMHLLTQPRRSPQRPESPGTSPNAQRAHHGARRLPRQRSR